MFCFKHPACQTLVGTLLKNDVEFMCMYEKNFININILIETLIHHPILIYIMLCQHLCHNFDAKNNTRACFPFPRACFPFPNCSSKFTYRCVSVSFTWVLFIWSHALDPSLVVLLLMQVITRERGGHHEGSINLYSWNNIISLLGTPYLSFITLFKIKWNSNIVLVCIDSTKIYLQFIPPFFVLLLRVNL